MKPSLGDILTDDPGLPREGVAEILGRLNDRYFSAFDPEERNRQIRALLALSPEKNLDLRIRELPDGLVEATVISYDYPGEFSILTGLLGVTGFHVRSGSIHTFSHAVPSVSRSRGSGPSPRRRSGSKGADDDRSRRKIVDRFEGRLERGKTFAAWKREFGDRLTAFMKAMDKGGDAVLSVKRELNDLVAGAIAERRIAPGEALLPAAVEADPSASGCTRFIVTAADTPFFLYSLSSALSLHRISIENVLIETSEGRVRDVFDFLTPDGRPLDDEELLAKLKFSILFTKQFTYFLDKAPDPHSAFVRFESLLQELTRTFTKSKIEETLKDPETLKDLAKLLGTSDFLWEDFVRLNYESLFSLLSPVREGRFLSADAAEVEAALAALLRDVRDPEEAKKRLNEFKNREIYLIDLDHILRPEAGFRFLSRRLTDLAAAVIRAAADLAWSETTRRYGIPRTVANLPAKYSILGLGKLGGEALGYASDIEILFVFDDNGYTDGGEKVSNAEFFERTFRLAASLIEAKREGIFEVDLRLRPYGNAGPVAVSLMSFCTYYGAHGDAMSYERLALVRMRSIGGDRELGARIERLRDEFVYNSGGMDLEALRSLRRRQLDEKRGESRLNAKFSPGGLVDLEYTVQILQVEYGKDNPGLRTPRIHEAIDNLACSGVMDRGEAKAISDAYDFFRTLINGLRMLRGNAHDLFLPEASSAEYLHLARRIGYLGREGLQAADELRMDFETWTATIRRFIEVHLGRAAIPGERWGTIADIVLSPDPPDPVVKRVMGACGIADERRALRNLRSLSEGGGKLFAPLSVLAWDMIGGSADPDMALNNWERFAASAADKAELFRGLLSQPRKLGMLFSISAGSQFLANTLIADPDFLDWVSDPAIILAPRSRAEMAADLGKEFALRADPEERRDAVRRFRRREILRIGTRDLCLDAPLEETTEELSCLAEAVIEAELAQAFESGLDGVPAPAEAREGFTVFAFGKLGGRELNYSSDLDLLGAYEDEFGRFSSLYWKVFERTVGSLSLHNREGGLYRIDLRLRPFGSSGSLVSGFSDLRAYYAGEAKLWEIQALLKLRPVAGNIQAGERLAAELLRTALGTGRRDEVRTSVDFLREASASNRPPYRNKGMDVKNGPGGIRDVEFLLQGLQLVHGSGNPGILTGNTLEGLKRIAEAGHLPEDIGKELDAGYRLLRRIEHFLQIFEDRQIHSLPLAESELSALAKRICPSDSNAASFLSRVEETMARILEARKAYL